MHLKRGHEFVEGAGGVPYCINGGHLLGLRFSTADSGGLKSTMKRQTSGAATAHLKRCPFKDNSLRDALQSRDEGLFLLRFDSTQIEQHRSFFYPGNDWRLALTKPRTQFISAHSFALHGEDVRG